MIWIVVMAILLVVLAIVLGSCKAAGMADDLEESYKRPPKVVEPVEDPLPVETWVRYPVPLDDGLQKYIIKLCAEKQISPALVMAVIGTESQYNAGAIGDHGNSFGLMQIYKSYHEDRMRKLGVSDLMNPYENVTVGIDILAELIDRGNGLEWALSYYSGNGGAECEYSHKVMRLAECILEGVMIVNN